ncbi:RND family efflux transporter MFP subunit [Sinobacterium caligoides]|uniref:RND family efflux transporter MFP subunit n=2 Tax=Sinobacterium caligoides TaxID=933926 RepID=A0A3N2E163_9GAMM|nr:RND family efflux transporter MFP subunit [Sinobacterium caligoides]
MQLRRAKKPLLIIMVSVAIAAVMVVMRPEVKRQEVIQEPLPIDVLEVHKSGLKVNIQSYGEVLPRTESTLASEVTGKIVAVSNDFVAGGFFNKGDELLRIDDRRYRVALKRCEAEVARAKSMLAQAQGKAHVAEQQWRQRTGKQLDQAAKDLALNKPQLQEALANLESARANLQQAKDDLSNTVIRAPFDGLLREKHADIGSFVAVGAPLAVAFAVDYAEVRLPIPEYQLDYMQLPEGVGRMNVESPVTLRSNEAGVQRQWSAQLVRTEGVLDQRSRVLHVVARINDPYGLHDANQQPILRVGSFVEAEIDGRMIEGLIAVPAHVLRPGNVLWVVDEEDRLQQREVVVLPISDEERYVQSGLRDGDKVCLTSVGAVLPGRQVVINNANKVNNEVERMARGMEVEVEPEDALLATPTILGVVDE